MEDEKYENTVCSDGGEAEKADDGADKEVNEIISYYENNETVPVLDCERKEETPKIINKLKKYARLQPEQRTVSEEAAEEKNKKIPMKYILFSAAAVLVIIIGFAAGFFVFSINSDKVEAKLSALMKTDAEYLEANSENSTLNASIKALENDGENIEKTFDTMVEYQKQYDSLLESYNAYKSEYDGLNAEYNQLKSGYDKILSKLSDMEKETVALTPGIHTVGRQIPEGSYSVTGNGSMLAADSNGSLKINTILDDKAYGCELKEGDIIKLETKAEFVPEED